MSLPLPDFNASAPSRAAPRATFALGLAFLGVVTAQWLAEASALRGVLERLDGLRGSVASLESTEKGRREALRRSPQRVVAATAVTSSPDRVLADLAAVLPPDVALRSLRGHYGEDGVARFELRVDATSAAGYDRFLEALTASPRFAEIRPGSEAREGPVSASLTFEHRAESRVRPERGEAPTGGR